jgi:hypothetical protein
VVRIAADTGQRLGMVGSDNEPMALAAEIAKAGEQSEMVLEAAYGWCWEADVLAPTPVPGCAWRIDLFCPPPGRTGWQVPTLVLYVPLVSAYARADVIARGATRR